MKSKLLLFILLFTVIFSEAQVWEIGGSIGPMTYQGDLAQPPVQVQKTNLCIGGLIKYRVNPLLSIRAEVNLGKVSGDDQYAAIPPEGYQHRKRNCSFYSNIFEVSGSVELNFFKFDPAARRTRKRFKRRFTPFISAGIGIFHFNPMTTYQGQVVQLQPLQTEINKPLYSLTQLCFPVGGGLKFAVGKKGFWSFTVNYATRFTLTDYIDDVSHNWQSNPTPGSLGQELSYRGDEIGYGPSTLINYNDPNNPRTVNRGDPRDRDTYLFFGFCISRVIGQKVSCGTF